MNSCTDTCTFSLQAWQKDNMEIELKPQKPPGNPKPLKPAHMYRHMEFEKSCLTVWCSFLFLLFFFSNPFYYQTSKDVWILKISVPIYCICGFAQSNFRKSHFFTITHNRRMNILFIPQWIFLLHMTRQYSSSWWIQWHSLLWKEWKPSIGVTKLVVKVYCIHFFSAFASWFLYITYNLVFFC